MKRGIFIIHSSEIIRQGLGLILRKHFNIETALLEDISQMDSFAEISDSKIVIITEPIDNTGKKLVNRLRQNNEVEIVQLVNDNASAKKDGQDYSINLQSTIAHIKEIISNIFKNRNNRRNESPEQSKELTHREKDVLKSVALGLSNKEIADKLFISIHTVISHRKNITEKLGIKSISGLTVYAIINNIIDTDNINPENLI